MTKNLDRQATAGGTAVDSGVVPTTGWHLSTTPLEAATTELEWALLRWREAFTRYNLHALNMIGLSDVSPAEMVLQIGRAHV